MSLQDRLAKKAAPLLEPGESIQAIVAVQTFHPALQFLGFLWVLLFGGRYRLVVATDRRIAVLKTKVTSYRHPIAVLESLPRETTLGPVGGPPAWIKVGGRELYIIAGTKKYVAVADQARPAAPSPQPTGAGVEPMQQAASQAPPAGWYRDPSGTSALRYWDGTQWTTHTNTGQQ